MFEEASKGELMYLLALTEVPQVLIVEVPWDPRLQRVGCSFGLSGVLCLFTKIFGTFFLCPKDALPKNHTFFSLIVRIRHTCALMGTLPKIIDIATRCVQWKRGMYHVKTFRNLSCIQ